MLNRVTRASKRRAVASRTLSKSSTALGWTRSSRYAGMKGATTRNPACGEDPAESIETGIIGTIEVQAGRDEVGREGLVTGVVNPGFQAAFGRSKFRCRRPRPPPDPRALTQPPYVRSNGPGDALGAAPGAEPRQEATESGGAFHRATVSQETRALLNESGGSSSNLARPTPRVRVGAAGRRSPGHHKQPRSHACCVLS